MCAWLISIFACMLNSIEIIMWFWKIKLNIHMFTQTTTSCKYLESWKVRWKFGSFSHSSFNKCIENTYRVEEERLAHIDFTWKWNQSAVAVVFSGKRVENIRKHDRWNEENSNKKHRVRLLSQSNQFILHFSKISWFEIMNFLGSCVCVAQTTRIIIK